VIVRLGNLSFIHSFSSLSYDRSKASSKASSPHGAIQSFLLQMRVTSKFRKQKLNIANFAASSRCTYWQQCMIKVDKLRTINNIWDRPPLSYLLHVSPPQIYLNEHYLKHLSCVNSCIPALLSQGPYTGTFINYGRENFPGRSKHLEGWIIFVRPKSMLLCLLSCTLSQLSNATPLLTYSNVATVR
jgi:hypothetical protein